MFYRKTSGRVDKIINQVSLIPVSLSISPGGVDKQKRPGCTAGSRARRSKKPVADVSMREREALIKLLTDWRFRIRGTRSWPSAQVTAGGINTAEIDEKTMESKLVPGLFFAGEVMDIDGQCGGFNLQWAWSSGYIAGKYAAE